MELKSEIRDEEADEGGSKMYQAKFICREPSLYTYVCVCGGGGGVKK